MAITDNLRAAYKLDSVSDGTSNAYNLTNTNSVTFGTGLIGNCAIFGATNTNKKLDVTSNLGIAVSGDWTISYWVRNNAVNVGFGGMQITYGSGTKYFSMIHDGANTRWFAITPSGNLPVVATISANTWYSVIIENSGTTATVYINNASIGTLSTSTTTSSLTDHFELGYSTALATYYSGDIDSCYVWDRVIGSTDRATIYNSGSGYEISIASPIAGGTLSMMGI